MVLPREESPDPKKIPKTPFIRGLADTAVFAEGASLDIQIGQLGPLEAAALDQTGVDEEACGLPLGLKP